MPRDRFSLGEKNLSSVLCDDAAHNMAMPDYREVKIVRRGILDDTGRMEGFFRAIREKSLRVKVAITGQCRSNAANPREHYPARERITSSNIAIGAIMGISRFRTSACLLALSAALLAIGEIPAHAASATSALFGNCQDIKKAIPGAGDGTYVLYDNGTLFTVYCHDMAGTPSEYIDLAETGQNLNYSQYTAGGASPGTNVRTTFTKLRINPATMTVDIGDLTFASSTGSTSNGSTVITSMPYGVAMSCTAPQTADGVANIDLENTPFQVDNTFAVGGYEATGSATVSADNQVANLTGGGYCGWITPAPALYNPYNPRPGMYQLKLRCAQDPIALKTGQFCINLG